MESLYETLDKIETCWVDKAGLELKRSVCSCFSQVLELKVGTTMASQFCLFVCFCFCKQGLIKEPWLD